MWVASRCWKRQGKRLPPEVGRIVTPKGGHVLVPRTCDYVVFYGRGDFASVIKSLEMGILC